MSQIAADPDTTYYYASAQTIRRRVASTAADTLVIDLGAAPHLLTGNIDGGGTGGITADGWQTWGQSNGVINSASKTCAVDLANGQAFCTPTGDLLARMTSTDFFEHHANGSRRHPVRDPIRDALRRSVSGDDYWPTFLIPFRAVRRKPRLYQFLPIDAPCRNGSGRRRLRRDI